jgi:hypothetical protein
MSTRQNQIKLNIGGTIFTTTRPTLVKSTYFTQLLDPNSNMHINTDGSIFIDRDATHFRHILNYLREGLVPSLNSSDMDQLISEADHYKLTDLIAALRAKLTGPGMGGRSRKATKRRRRRYK